MPVDVFRSRGRFRDIAGNRLGRLPREDLHFRCHNGETAAARPRRLDRRVKREQIGLLGDLANQLGNLANLFGAGGNG